MKSTVQRSGRWMCCSAFSSVPAVHQSIAGRTRFYKDVNVAATPDGLKYNVTLDGRVLKTPARNPLDLPNIDLAMAIALEWDAQNEKSRGIQPVNMPMMSLASTAIDQVALHPPTVIETCMKYLPTDAGLFIAPDHDRILLAKQKEYLFPILEWYKDKLKLDLGVTQSMASRITHSDEVMNRIEGIISKMDHFTLTCLQGAVLESKSLVLALAYIARHMTMDDMLVASRLEEEFQVEIWGLVEGGHDMDRLNNAVRISSVGTFMSLHYDNKQLEQKWTEWTK